MEPYIGIRPDRLYRLNNTVEDIVLRSVEPLQNTNRNKTGDNRFTKLSLVKK